MEMSFPKLEERVLRKWKAIHAFETSVEQRKRGPRFVFYDGPPTANAGPGIHHMLNRVYKDVVLRYKSMRGFFVPRRAGWDTHGLPVELQIEKALGLKSKRDIEAYGIARFNQKCRDSVWKYKGEWERFNERVGLWIDMENPYITYETSYMETLWWIVKRLWQEKLLYRDYKVVPYCPRCETPLSSHELAQGYQTVKEAAVYVKFALKGKVLGQGGVKAVAWTTTPWTLPGNVALAVHPNLPYIVARKDGELLLVAESRAEEVLGDYELVQKGKGKDLLGIQYDPVFRFKDPEEGKKVWEIVPADFVSAEDGSGLVHTAVAYGAEDFELGKQQNLAMLHLVKENGTFTEEVIPWKGMPVKEADPYIIQELEKKESLFKKEEYEHEYPHCWRCGTPLLYYAKESWFVNMQKVKRRLIAENKKVHWVPEHIKKGRMGEWLAELKDWAFSRERFWGTPLPVWECGSCSATEVIGSVKELALRRAAKNTYYLMRHGHSVRQETKEISSYPEPRPIPLTAKGRAQAKKAAKELKGEKIDLVLASDLQRTKQTADILAKELGVEVMTDPRLRELDMGKLNGKHVGEFGKLFSKEGETEKEHYLARFRVKAPEGENWVDVQRRVYALLKEVEKTHAGKRILMVSHRDPLILFEGMARGLSRGETADLRMHADIQPGEWRKIQASLLPYNKDMELDLHRPYIDEVTFACASCKEGTMSRVKEVIDVWYDSGAMPFAQAHWPFEAKGKRRQTADKLVPPEEFPADYIVEAIDQTRGWFYTLLAVSSLLGFQAPYKNVISLSHVLDEKGQKMSKSKGNVVNPWTMMDTYGTDTLRWYFFTVNNPGDAKLFSEKDIVQVQRRFMNTLANSLVFSETYRQGQGKAKIGTHVLDRWIASRLMNVSQVISDLLDAYNITEAGRALEDFVVNDLSLWYIRRSRTRFQNPKTKKELEEASSSLAWVLQNTAKLAAPFTPFFAEHVYGSSGGAKQSVHWEDWPQTDKKLQDAKLEQEMKTARDLVAQALAARSRAGVKVRQPLAKLMIKKKLRAELLELIAEEINVKEVEVSPNLPGEVQLDFEITPELKQEGMLRELLRHIQDMRKRAGYKPRHRVFLWYSGDDPLAHIISHRADEIARAVSLKKIQEAPRQKMAYDIEEELSIEGERLWVGMKKA